MLMRSTWTPGLLCLAWSTAGQGLNLQQRWRGGGTSTGGESSASHIRNTHGSKVLVIGAGIGGLACAAKLSRAGFEVEVLEKNHQDSVGGRLNELVVHANGGSYRFDTGPSLLLLPDVYRDVFADLGTALDDRCELRRVDPSYKVFFGDGSSVQLSNDISKMELQLEAIEPGSFKSYERYLEYAQLNLEVGLPNFIQERITLDRFPEFAINAVIASPLGNHHKLLEQRFKSPKLRAMLSFQDLYVGLTPYSAPAVFSLLQAIELNEGIYYPVGGFHQVPKLLLELCLQSGVTFRYGQAVTEVVTEKRRAAGVRLQTGEVLPADIVLANADVPYVEEQLVPPKLSRDLSRAAYSSGVIAFYWAVNRTFPQLSHHSIFLSEDYRGSWESVFEKGRLGDDFNFYVAAPARTDPSACPPGHDSIMVLVPCPTIDPADSEDVSRGKFDRWRKRAREGVLAKFEGAAKMEGFRDSIVHETVYTPLDWRERYNLQRGAAFGFAHGLNQLSIFRPSPQHPKIGNLYFCGASTRPGNGVPLVLIGAQLVSDLIAKQHQHPRKS